MYLRELIINGFKSFADSTRLELDPGVTAIVGPNGCGKSNIADAIRWVLGEQSAKALRGGKMQDIIFSGSDTRKALPFSEVYLTFSNCEEELGSAFNEVEIGRRVSRDGSGIYTINRKVCRLKDIQRLFMDTGVGRVSYSFLVQGQVDQILSSNPADRRAVFEEAAGITKYKSQRREALNKLDLVEANLGRVTDVIEEVGRQIGTLRRQASKALRFKRLKHRLSHLELAHGGYEYANLQASISQFAEDASTTAADLARIRTGIAEKEAASESISTQRTEAFQRLQEQQQVVFDRRSEKEQSANQATFEAQRARDLGERIDVVEREIAELTTQRDLVKSQSAEEAGSRQAQLNLVGSSDATFREIRESLQKAEDTLITREKELSREKQRYLVVESGISRLRTNATSIEVDLKSAQVRHGDLVDALKTIESELQTARQHLETLVQSEPGIRQRHETTESTLATARESVDTRRNAFRRAQESIQQAEREVARRNAELNLLEDLQRKFEGFGDGAKAILNGKLKDRLPPDQVTVFTREIVVEESHTDAFETALGEAIDGILLPSADNPGGLADALREGKLGQACLLLPKPSGSAEPPLGPTEPLPDWLIPAHTVVTPKSDAIQPLLTRLLDGAYLIPDLNVFTAFLSAHPTFFFRVAATPDGDRIDSRGTIIAGRRKSRSGSFIQRENQIRAIRKEIGTRREALDTLYQQANLAQEDLTKAETAVEESRTRLNEASAERTALEAQIRAARKDTENIEGRAERARHQLQRFENEQGEARDRLASAREQLTRAESELAQSREAVSSLEDAVANARNARDEVRQSLSTVQLELAEKKQRLEILNRSISETARQTNELNSRIETNRTRLNTMREDIATASERAKTLRERAEALSTVVEGAAGQLAAYQNRVKELDAALADAGRLLAAQRQAEREAEQRNSRAEVELARLRSRRDFIVEKLENEYEVEAGSVNWRQSLWDADEPFETRINLDDIEDSETVELQPKHHRGEPTEEDFARMDETDWEAVATEIKQLRDKIAAIGAVNLVAIEEYAELRQRYDFLKSQSEDLWNSKEELLRAIDEINQTSQSLFQQTFEQIRKNFQYTYEHLTIGGKGDLELHEAEDILESGIEIIARPPGTRLSTISLLSGGQRTMAAVALLFAIYMVKPSPFCFLDELDAPLDDANIGRFTEMLRDFTRFSQFLIITHNKRTVASADSVFGVTMQEKGVSKLVSMRFNRTTETPEFSEPALA